MDGRNPAPVDRWLIPLFTGFQPSKAETWRVAGVGKCPIKWVYKGHHQK